MEDKAAKSYMYMAALVGGVLGVLAVIGAFFWRRELESSADNTTGNLSTVLPAILLFAGICLIIWAILVVIVRKYRSDHFGSKDTEQIPSKILSSEPDKSLSSPLSNPQANERQH